MVRYVSGDFDWKFAFGDQSSSFGEVLETICKDLDDCYVSRYVGTGGQGEIVEFTAETPEDFEKACLEYIGDFKEKTTEEYNKSEEIEKEVYWDKMMIKKFLKEANWRSGEQLNFYVEY